MIWASVAELVDACDSKSHDRKVMGVQVSPEAFLIKTIKFSVPCGVQVSLEVFLAVIFWNEICIQNQKK